MKIETKIASSIDGTVKEIFLRENDKIEARDLVLELE
jgi:biotin carboxyl carrier protein